MQFSLISSYYVGVFFPRSFPLQKLLYSSVPSLLCTNHSQLLWRQLTSPWSSHSSRSGCLPLCLWQGWKEMQWEGDASIWTTQLPFPNQSLCSSGCGIQRCYLVFNIPERVSFFPTVFQTQIRFHIQNFSGRNSAVKPRVTKIAPF